MDCYSDLFICKYDPQISRKTQNICVNSCLFAVQIKKNDKAILTGLLKDKKR